MTDVVMPQMGESIVEGTLTMWLKKAGDHVERDEPLFEISTDKVDTEIPSPAAGTLSEIVVEEGKTVGINTVVGRISDGAGVGASPATAEPARPSPAPIAQPPVPQATAPPSPAPPAAPPVTVVEETAGPLSPLVRKMARENNIDLSQVKGTGVGGRITKLDLDNYLAQRPGQAAQAPVPQPPAPSAAVPAPPPPPAVTYGEMPSTRVEP